MKYIAVKDDEGSISIIAAGGSYKEVYDEMLRDYEKEISDAGYDRADIENRGDASFPVYELPDEKLLTDKDLISSANSYMNAYIDWSIFAIRL